MITLVRAALLACLLFGLNAIASAQDPPAGDAPAATRPAPAARDDAPLSQSRRMSPPATPAPSAPSGQSPFRALLPNFSGTTIMWIAVVLTLALLLQTRPFLSWLNLDAIMLAVAAVALAFRSETAPCPVDGPTLQYWSYAILTAVCIYWLGRGLQLTLRRAVPTRSANVSEGAMLVLIVAVMALGFNTVINAPLSDASRDGLAGGIYMAETGKLPYGDLPGRDYHGPLLYALHAGAVRVAPIDASSGALTWDNRGEWLDGDRLQATDPLAPRLVNGLLFVLLLIGMGMIGQRLHSVAMGWTLVAILVVFPGTLECLEKPDVMLPAVLLTWAVAFLTMGAAGPFFATLFVVFAGLASPWAWLALPVLLIYFARRGWQALAVVGAMLIGVAAVGAMLLFLVRPTLPRADGALAAAGRSPSFAAVLEPNGTVVRIEKRDVPPPPSDFKALLWQCLLDAESTSVGTGFDVPPGTNAANVFYRDLATTAASRERVQGSYRDAVAAWPDSTRLLASLRSVLECVWRPEGVRVPVLPTPWTLWFGAGPEAESNRMLTQRIVKGAVGALVLFLCWRMTRAPRPELPFLLGALLAITAGAMLASERGAVVNWVWLLPLALAVVAAPVDPGDGTRQNATPRASPPPQPTRPSSPSVFASRSSEPRISVER